MSDQGRAISLAQLPPSSDDESSQQSSRNLAALSGSVIGGSPSCSKLKKSPPSAGYSLLGGANEHRMILSSKKPRGRPPGSKNKPKPPVVITKENEQALKPAVIDIAVGSDVVETVVQFARRRNVSVTVLSGTGVLSNVRLRHPVSANRLLTYTGNYHMVSLSGSYIIDSHSPHSSSNPSSSGIPPPACSSFGVCLLGPQGNCFGGIVGGEVIAATPVVVVVTTFKNPCFERVLIDGTGEEDRQDVKTGVSAEQGTSFGHNAMPVAAYSAAAAASGHVPSPLRIQAAPHNVLQWGHATRNPHY